MFRFKSSSLFREQPKLRKPSVEQTLIYNSETDIYPYHNYAVWKLKQNVDCPETKSKLKNIASKLSGSGNLSLSEYYDLENEKNALEEKLQQAPKLLETYLAEVKDVLKELSSVGSSTLGYVEPLAEQAEPCDRKSLIAKFQKIFNKYIPEITMIPEDVANDCCQKCNAKVTLLEDEDLIDCPNCGITLLENLAMSVEYLGLNVVKAYESVHNFARALEEFQGNVKLPPNSVIQKVKDYVTEHQMQLDQLYALDIRSILKTLGYNSWYKASHLILHKVTGSKLHDISDIKDALLADFQILDRLYKQNKLSERQSSINVWKIMEVLLRKHGYECHTRNFKKPVTGDINIENNRILIQLFALANWDTSLVM